MSTSMGGSVNCRIPTALALWSAEAATGQLVVNVFLVLPVSAVVPRLLPRLPHAAGTDGWCWAWFQEAESSGPLCHPMRLASR